MKREIRHGKVHHSINFVLTFYSNFLTTYFEFGFPFPQLNSTHPNSYEGVVLLFLSLSKTKQNKCKLEQDKKFQIKQKAYQTRTKQSKEFIFFCWVYLECIWYTQWQSFEENWIFPPTSIIFFITFLLKVGHFVHFPSLVLRFWPSLNF